MTSVPCPQPHRPHRPQHPPFLPPLVPGEDSPHLRVLAQSGPGQGVSGYFEGVGGWAGGGRPKLHSGPVPPNSKFPQTAAEWAEVLALQKQFHSVEVHKWRQILRASVELLDEVRPGLWDPALTPKRRQVPLGLSFLLHKMRRPFVVPTFQGCPKNQQNGKIECTGSHPGPSR